MADVCSNPTSEPVRLVGNCGHYPTRRLLPCWPVQLSWPTTCSLLLPSHPRLVIVLSLDYVFSGPQWAFFPNPRSPPSLKPSRPTFFPLAQSSVTRKNPANDLYLHPSLFPLAECWLRNSVVAPQPSPGLPGSLFTFTTLFCQSVPQSTGDLAISDPTSPLLPPPMASNTQPVSPPFTMGVPAPSWWALHFNPSDGLPFAEQHCRQFAEQHTHCRFSRPFTYSYAILPFSSQNPICPSELKKKYWTFLAGLSQREARARFRRTGSSSVFQHVGATYIYASCTPKALAS